MAVMTLTCPPLSQADAEQFGRALSAYAITVTHIGVTHVWADGSRHRNAPLRDTVGPADRAHS